MGIRRPDAALAAKWEAILDDTDGLINPAKLDRDISRTPRVNPDDLTPSPAAEEAATYYRQAPQMVERFAEDRPLSPRERGILCLYVDGVSKRQIRTSVMCDQNLVLGLTRDFDRYCKALGLNPPSGYPRKPL